MIELTQQQIEQFGSDGFLILERFLAPDEVEAARARFEPLFRGSFETGLYPDEWNWQEGRDAADRTRQICNGWKSDRTIARIVLKSEIGQLCATLAGWSGARVAQDNVTWKPPGAKPLGFHQDDSYCHWVVPAGFVTCWMALDDTSAAGGTIEYARGSHRWGTFPPIRQFHAPDDYREALAAAARAVGESVDLVPVEVAAGGCVIHSGGIFHGSDRNRTDRPRRSLVTHCIAAEARFHPSEISYVYNRYKRVGDETMDESFFPILWRRDGYRSAFLGAYLAGSGRAA
jgi:ectoine hydroxylase-related dioxygenase (phytanoyl-CoA dioxygenase family)